jgi:hypothetical protein
MQALLGSTVTWVNRGTNESPDWWQETMLSHIQAMEFVSLDDFLSECAAAGIEPTEPTPPVSEPVPPAPVPNVTPLQLRIWINHNRGLLGLGEGSVDDLIVAAINASAMSATDKEDAKNSYYYALTIQRNSPFTASLGLLFGMDNGPLDEAFWQASVL